MRYFDHMIFMGNAHPEFPCTQADMRLLHRRLKDAFSHISGMQQGAFHPDFLAELAKEDEREDIVRDIAAALLGKNIEITTDCEDKGLSSPRFKRTGDRECWHNELLRRRNERARRRRLREVR